MNLDELVGKINVELLALEGKYYRKMAEYHSDVKNCASNLLKSLGLNRLLVPTTWGIELLEHSFGFYEGKHRQLSKVIETDVLEIKQDKRTKDRRGQLQKTTMKVAFPETTFVEIADLHSWAEIKELQGQLWNLGITIAGKTEEVAKLKQELKKVKNELKTKREGK